VSPIGQREEGELFNISVCTTKRKDVAEEKVKANTGLL